MIDPTYRWIVVGGFSAVIAVSFLYSAYRRGFDPYTLWPGLVAGSSCIGYAVLMSRVFGEDLLDALLLRVRFGMPFSDSGIQGYGWGFVLGYALLISMMICYLLGNLGLRFGIFRSSTQK